MSVCVLTTVTHIITAIHVETCNPACTDLLINSDHKSVWPSLPSHLAYIAIPPAEGHSQWALCLLCFWSFSFLFWRHTCTCVRQNWFRSVVEHTLCYINSVCLLVSPSKPNYSRHYELPTLIREEFRSEPSFFAANCLTSWYFLTLIGFLFK